MSAHDSLGHLYENSPFPRDAIQEALEFGNVEPLCRLIEKGDADLWADEQVRGFIARVIRNGKGLQRGSGKRAETNRIKVRRDEWIFERLCYWNGFGLPLYGDGKNANYVDACLVVAKELARIASEYNWTEIDAESIKSLWKKHDMPAGMRVLQEDYGRMLRDAAEKDSKLRKKIKETFCFDVERRIQG